MPRPLKMASEAEEKAFEFIGWAVRLSDGSYLKQVDPIGLTGNERDAMVWVESQTPDQLILDVSGSRVEVWARQGERMMCYDDHSER
jgi:hypothetical protein